MDVQCASTTLGPVDYNSFAMAILSHNHQEIEIAELISVSTKVIIESFPNDVVNNMATSLTAEEKMSFFFTLGGQFSSKFDTVIRKTPSTKLCLYSQGKSINFAHFQVIIASPYTLIKEIPMTSSTIWPPV